MDDDSRRIAVRVTRDALRHVHSGHPWVFEGSITSVSHEGSAGDLAVIFDDRGRFAAIGLWDPDSPIRVKVLHAGAPQPIDAGFWRRRISEALTLRSRFTRARDAADLGYRVLHGENDGLPGLVADRYAAVLVVKLYSTAWLPHLDVLLAELTAATECTTVVLRASRRVVRDSAWQSAGFADGQVVRGALASDLVRFRENGLWFDADVRHGQKTGHFLDQRATRAAVRDRAHGRRVLDVFCSTGGFTVHAAAGGAISVTSVDQSLPTLAMVEGNLALNRDRPAVAACGHEVIAGDAFAVFDDLRRQQRRFDLVIVDPPSFASRADDVPGAERAYRRLTRSALDVLTPGGTLVQASCSSRVSPERFFELVESEARVRRRPLKSRARNGHDVDHPVGFAEGEYLKAGFWMG